jgi:hypothetical protein
MNGGCHGATPEMIAVAYIYTSFNKKANGNEANMNMFSLPISPHYAMHLTFTVVCILPFSSFIGARYVKDCLYRPRHS